MFSRKIRVYHRDSDRESDILSRSSASRKTSVTSTRDRSDRDDGRDRDRDRDPSERRVSKHRSLDSKSTELRRPSGLRVLSHSQSHNLAPPDPHSPGTISRMTNSVMPDISRPTSVTAAESMSHSALHKQCSQETVQAAPHRHQHDSPFTPDPTDVCNTPSPSSRDTPRRSKTPVPPSPPLTDNGDKRAKQDESSKASLSEHRSKSKSSSSRHKRYEDAEKEKPRSSKSSSSKGDRERRHRTESSRTDPTRSKTSRSSKDGSRRRRDPDGSDTPDRSDCTATPRIYHDPPNVVYTHNLAVPAPVSTSSTPFPISPATPGDNEPIPNPTFRTHHNAPPRPSASSQAPVAQPTQAPTEICEFPHPRSQSTPLGNYANNSGMYDLSEGSAPPPPPPEMMAPHPPRVDYLLQNGGLVRQVPRNLLDLAPALPAVIPNGLPASSMLDIRAQSVFAPFSRLLQDYTEVMRRNGSVAVASGYRSVARRLLERLEAVFARNISSEFCNCFMCPSDTSPERPPEARTGMSWGEILEYVAGRRELPQWPAFTLSSSAIDLESTVGAPEAPMQKLDVDVPEAYRHHYVRQSQKTKQAVQTWLATQPEEATSPPLELDDDTVTFAIVTHLDPVMRQLYVSMLPEANKRASSVQGEPVVEQAADGASNAEIQHQVLAKAQLAVQRLYRLEAPPREPECALYLIKNPEIHAVIATIAAVSEHEWDILVSGRFDGFLWSGADEYPINRPGPISRPSTVQVGAVSNVGRSSIGFSNTPTPSAATGATPMSAYASPAQISRAATASAPPSGTVTAQAGAPVSLDEENEIAALADVERSIYASMEALENAFEVLHNQAEHVRRQLVDRSAGLLMQSQVRRGVGRISSADVRGLTPLSGLSGLGSGMMMHPDGNQSVVTLDNMTELGPDDSVSNVSSYRRRRRKEKSARSRRMVPRPEVVPEEDV